MKRLALVLLLACSSKERAAAPPPDPAPPAPAPSSAPAPGPDPTPNSFFAQGVTPTIIVGTGGDAATNRDLSGQAAFVRAMAFPDARLLTDNLVDAKAPPVRPVVYGGPHVNAFLAAFPLPFAMTADRLELGGRTFTGSGIQLITVLPAAAGRPEMLIYAGTGRSGVAEINGRQDKGRHPLLVVDAFGTLATGRWKAGANGALEAELGPDARRIPWRLEELHADAGVFQFAFPAQLPKRPDEEKAIIIAGSIAIDRAAKRLGLARLPPMTFYVYPDRRSKQTITGDPGDGHAVQSASALHMVEFPPAALEHLIAHEATHVITHAEWGAPGSVLLGEGVAVWASGRYQGNTLDEWKAHVPRRPIAELLGRAFKQYPEPETYPLAGMFVDAAVGAVGLDKVREHLFPATAATWADACKRAGTTPEALEQALTARLAP